MSDDIVTRLRNMTILNEGVIDMTINEAADEIERLRVEVARLGSFIHPIGTVVHDKAVRHDES